MATVQRRLSAILCADVSGYSRLVGDDEESTLAAIKSLQSEVIDPGLAQHNGRLVKVTGDGLLVEFASVVDATRCAVDIQLQMARRNSTLPPNRRIDWRIGINVGDIVVDGDDILGDAVVASRIEAMTEPGGVSLSRQAHDQVAGKLAMEFHSIGPQHLTHQSVI
jgi:adenylate cyclase